MGSPWNARHVRIGDGDNGELKTNGAIGPHLGHGFDDIAELAETRADGIDTHAGCHQVAGRANLQIQRRSVCVDVNAARLSVSDRQGAQGFRADQRNEVVDDGCSR